MNSQWLLIPHMVTHVFQCYSLNSSHSLLPNEFVTLDLTNVITLRISGKQVDVFRIKYVSYYASYLMVSH